MGGAMRACCARVPMTASARGYWVAYVGSFEATSRGRKEAERVRQQLPGSLVRLIR